MKVQIVITRDEKGSVAVSGPLADRMLCYGLLEIAKDVVREQSSKKNAITPATMLEIPGRNGG